MSNTKEVLDNIRTEILEDMNYYANVRDRDAEKWCSAKRSGLNRALEIIDKHIKENT